MTGMMRAGLDQVTDQLVPVPHHGLQNLFCTNCFIPRFDLGLVVQNHVQQGIMDFQSSVVIDEAQFAEFVHEKAYVCDRVALRKVTRKSVRINNHVNT
jgi:hypothetical protein